MVITYSRCGGAELTFLSLSALYTPWPLNGIRAILVEDTGSGQSLIQELKYQSALPIIPVSVDRDKIARAQAVTPLIEAGKVFLPELAPWVHDYYLDELAAFPNGVHDDAFDSTTQSLNYLRHQQVHTVAIFNALTGRCLSD